MRTLRFRLFVALSVVPFHAPAAPADSAAQERIIEPFPILSYDTDTGLGYGGKVVFRNQLSARESFDCTIFNSTKGERWYRFAMSLPDGELRHGTLFPAAVDVILDYDRWVNFNYFGMGNGSSFADREHYTREAIEAGALLSRALSARLVAQAGIRMRVVRNAVGNPGSRLTAGHPLDDDRAAWTSVSASLRYDGRNSTLHPSTGVVLAAEIEQVIDGLPGNTMFTRYGVMTQGYIPLLDQDLLVAGRFHLQTLTGGSVPVQALLPIGGNATLRGSAQDRFLDRTAAIANAELRFRIYRRLAGIAGLDAGRVWHSPALMGWHGWHVNPTAGLRLIMETFVVRLDCGFGRETTGVYFNFGHIF